MCTGLGGVKQNVSQFHVALALLKANIDLMIIMLAITWLYMTSEL